MDANSPIGKSQKELEQTLNNAKTFNCETAFFGLNAGRLVLCMEGDDGAIRIMLDPAFARDMAESIIEACDEVLLRPPISNPVPGI